MTDRESKPDGRGRRDNAIAGRAIDGAIGEIAHANDGRAHANDGFARAKDARTAPRFRYFLKVFGCQMNVADVNDLELTLKHRGGVRVQTEADADLVLVNTCVVRKKAEDKAVSYIGTLKRVKDENPSVFLVVTGCLLPKSRKYVERRFAFLDLLVDYSTPETVVEALDHSFPPMMADDAGDALPGDAGVEAANSVIALADAPPDAGEASAQTDLRKTGFVTIIRGCNNRCTYCIVPSVRGSEVSIPPEVIVADVARKHGMGHRMITLIGQNVLAYGKDRDGCADFAALVARVLAETDLPWLHFLTSHPFDLSDEMIARLYAHERVLSSLHLPFQAGADRILKLMARKYTRAHYSSRVAAVRAARPEIFISTDVIVGFPGETRAEFEESLDLMAQVRFNDAYMFKYSVREGTAAAEMPDSVPADEKRRRLSELIAHQHSISREVNAEYVGRRFTALVEEHVQDRALETTDRALDRASDRGSNRVIARLPINKPVALPECDAPPGEFVEVELTGVRLSTFDGIVVG